MMRSFSWSLSALSLSLSLALPCLAAPAFAAAPKTYQVTGPVIEVTDTTITVEKDKEKWLIARDKDTKVTGDLKAGARVTIQYRMSAASIDVKGDAKADPKAAAAAKPDKAAAKDAKDKPAKK